MQMIDPALEREYNNRALVPDHPAIFRRWDAASKAFRAHADATLDLAYGPADRHRLDLFHAPDPRGTLVFIHGGYWRSLDKSDFSFVAAPFVAAGLSIAAISYRLCPAVSIADIVADCRDALDWLLANGPAHGMPVKRLALAGHSAGGHLVSMLFATDWEKRGTDPAFLAGGAALSGVFDLEPLLRCSMNLDLRLASATEARAVSPACLRPRLAAPLYLAVGAEESAAFRGQTKRLRAAWPENCPTADEIPGCNHFTIVDHFVRPDSNGLRFLLDLFR